MDTPSGRRQEGAERWTLRGYAQRATPRAKPLTRPPFTQMARTVFAVLACATAVAAFSAPRAGAKAPVAVPKIEANPLAVAAALPAVAAPLAALDVPALRAPATYAGVALVATLLAAEAGSRAAGPGVVAAARGTMAKAKGITEACERGERQRE